MPSDEDAAAGRVVKRRSPRACVSCHRRKVRCDVVNGGVPCTNCRLDHVDCVLKQSNRGRKSKSKPKPTVPATISVAPAAAAAATGATRRTAAVAADRARQEQQEVQRSPVDPQLQSSYPMRDVDDDDEEDDQQDEDQQQQQTMQMQTSPEQQLQSPSSDASGQSEREHAGSKRKQPDDADAAQNGAAPRDFLFALAFENTSRQHSPSRSSVHGQHQHHRRRESRSITSASISPNAAASLHGHTRDHHHHHHPSEPHTAASSHHGSTYHHSAPGPSHPLLPSYIRPLSSRLKPRDIDYLADAGCFKIPDDEMRDELLRVYVRFVYPFMPTLDVEDFIAPILRSSSTSGSNSINGDNINDIDNEHDQVSLLLFQAVMFSSVTFVDASFLHARGYRSRRDARKDYFDRAHTLYSFSCEDDRTSTIQALLLMAYWYGNPDEDRDTWYWMGIALTAIQVAGFHRNPTSPHMPLKEKRLRRRIWWSCVIRDRLIGLGIRRPSRIRNEDMSIPMLSVDDFDLSPPSDLMRRLLSTGGGESAKFNYLDLETMTSVASTCVELAKLSVIAGHILHTQYTVAGTAEGGSSEFLTRAVVRPRRSKEQADNLDKCDAELSEWYQRNSAVLGMSEASSIRDTSTGILKLCQSLLQTIYLTTVGVLHRPQAFYTCKAAGKGDSAEASADADGSQQQPQQQDEAPYQESNKKVQDAAIALTKLAFDMQSRNLLRYASTSAIPALLSATLIHLLNTRSNDEEVRNISVGRFYHCFGALQQLQDMYASAEYTVRFIKTVLRTAHLNTPLLTMSLSNSSGDWDNSNSNKNSSSWQAAEADDNMSVDAATAYPSPSMSGCNNANNTNGNHHHTQNGAQQMPTAARYVQEEQPMQTPGVFQSLVAAAAAAGSSGDAWGTTSSMPMPTTQFHHHQHSNAEAQLELSYGSPYFGMLGDMDGLDPSLTLMTFDTDPAFLLASSRSRPAM